MKKRQLIYLDVCSLNRFFDDQTQDRVHLESEALLVVLARIERAEHHLVVSEAVEIENDQNPDAERRQKVRDVLRLAAYSIRVGRAEVARAEEILGHGLGDYDALHLACAESARADVLLTTDDDFVRKARRSGVTRVRVCNPLQWVTENRG